MKSFVIATLVAAVLVVGIFVSMQMRDDGLGGSGETVGAAQESRLRQLEDKLAAVDGLREDVKALADLVARLESRKEQRTADRTSSPGQARGARSSSPQRKSVDGEVVAAATERLKTPRGQEEFYGAVKAGVRRYQEEERQEKQRRTREIQQEIEEFRQGPYGKYNLKVNSMAKWLDLNDYQREVYHTQVAHFDALILSVGTHQREDPENREQYRQEREEREGLRQEFASIFVTSLLPEQTEIFNAMPDYQKRPDGEERMMTRVIHGHEARANRAEATESRRDSTTARER